MATERTTRLGQDLGREPEDEQRNEHGDDELDEPFPDATGILVLVTEAEPQDPTLHSACGEVGQPCTHRLARSDHENAEERHHGAPDQSPLGRWSRGRRAAVYGIAEQERRPER
jgi:hypothetical protein